MQETVLTTKHAVASMEISQMTSMVLWLPSMPQYGCAQASKLYKVAAVQGVSCVDQIVF